VPLDMAQLQHLLTWEQAGVVSRRQVLALGGNDRDIARLQRRRELVRVHPGVYVNHTGPMSPEQRQWAAVLALAPAALAEESALPGPPLPVVVVAVEAGRHLVVPRGVRVRRTTNLAARVDPMTSPPRVRLGHATIDVMARKVARQDISGAFSTLADVCHTRRTDPRRIAKALEERGRTAARTLIAAMLDDLATGACSVLERGYLHLVERAHGLPRGSRQHPSHASGHPTAHDVRYPDLGLEVELDGRAFHDNARGRDADARRDLAELVVASVTTVRVTYEMVFGDPCWTARKIADLMRRHGWDGDLTPCPRCPRTQRG